MRLHPDTKRKEQQEHSAHSHNGGAGQTPGAGNATWPPAATANPGVTRTTLQHQRYITNVTVEHCAADHALPYNY